MADKIQHTYRVVTEGVPGALHEGADEGIAREAALAASKGAPLHRYEVRTVPDKLTTADGKSLPNEGGRVERALAAYLGGREIPVA